MTHPETSGDIHVRASLGELARYFTRLGFTAFGGPAAHIAMMQDDLVERRRWVGKQHFLDTLAATQLAPGPNSTEMAIHVGYLHHGKAGMLLTGACFIIPAFLIVLSISIFYGSYGGLPQVSALFYGLQPVIVAIVLYAVYRLGLSACRRPVMLALAVAAFLVTLLTGVGTVWVIVGGGLVGAALYAGRRMMNVAPAALALGLSGALFQQVAAVEPTLWRLFLFFLKVGATAMGSGYVIVSYLADELVRDYGWLTHQQLVDAVAVGQMTPGPVFTTAGFAGYVIMAGPENLIGPGVAGATVSTLAIFLPSFLIVWAIAPVIPRLRTMKTLAAFLDGVNAAVVGSIAASCITLFAGAAVNLANPIWPVSVASYTVDLFAVGIFLVALGVMLALPRLNSTWLILAGALIGYVVQMGLG
jgi:chromate transporter